MSGSTAPSPTSPSPPVDPRRRIRVLVVDDALDHRMLISRRLTDRGMQVWTAADEAEALARLGDVELVLLDYQLEGSSGLDVLRRIRARPRAPSVVVVTGAGSTEIAVAAMRAGAIDYLVKDRAYLDVLPEVVQRAWRHHDLDARAAELQRLTLLVTSATDQAELGIEVVDGATRLLRAASCALVVEDGGVLTPVAVLGRDRGDVGALAARLDLRAVGGDDAPFDLGGVLVVPLPGESVDPLGALLVWPEHLGQLTAEERQLASVFASFAGLALRNVRQFELERQLVAELQRTLDVRRDFVASISHELRTPLTAIAGFNATLHAHWRQLDDGQRDDLLGRIGRNAEDLTALVDDLLQVAQVERGRASRIHLRRVALETEIAGTLDQLEHVLQGRELRVQLRPLVVVADVSLLRRTLANLLTNAVKYSEHGTPIDVRADVQGTYAVVEVADEGVGLPSWATARVFEPFFRARGSVADAVRGSGIGLALVRDYVHTMGGEVSVSSTPGQGSTFAFTLPLAEAGRSSVRDG